MRGQHYNNRPYRRGPVDYDDPQQHRISQRQFSGFKRPRNEYETIDIEVERKLHIRQLLVQIGNEPSSIIDHLKRLSQSIIVDLDKCQKYIISTLFECITHIGIKTPIYATLISLVANNNKEFGDEIIKTLINEIQLILIPKYKSNNLNNDSNNENDKKYYINNINLNDYKMNDENNNETNNNENNNNNNNNNINNSNNNDDNKDNNDNFDEEEDKKDNDNSNDNNNNNNNNNNINILEKPSWMSEYNLDNIYTSLITREQTRLPIDFNRLRLLLRFSSCLVHTSMINSNDLLDVLILLVNKILLNNEIKFLLMKDYISHIIISTLLYCNEILISQNINKYNYLYNHLSNYILIDNKDRLLTNEKGLKSLNSISLNVLISIFNELKRMYNVHMNKNDNNINNNNNNDNDMKEQKEENKNTNNKNEIFNIKSIKKPYKELLKELTSNNNKYIPFKLYYFPDYVYYFNNIFIFEHELNLMPVWLEFGIPELVHSKVTSNIRNSVNYSELFIVSEYIHDIFEYYYQDTKLCSDELIKVNKNFSSFHCQFLIMESLFFNLLKLPKPLHHFIFYSKIIIELFKKQVKVWPRVVGPIINKFFVEMENLDIECRDRIAEWFSFHLANFNFQWPWKNWSDIISPLTCQAPQRVFIDTVFIKCLNLSYYDKFIKTVPDEFVSLLPPKFEPVFSYSINTQNNEIFNMDVDGSNDNNNSNNENENNNSNEKDKENENKSNSSNNSSSDNVKSKEKLIEIGQELIKMIGHKQSVEDLTNYLDINIEIDETTETKENEEINLINLESLESMSQIDNYVNNKFTKMQKLNLKKVEILLECILHSGKSSVSHVMSFLKTYGIIIKKCILLMCKNSSDNEKDSTNNNSNILTEYVNIKICNILDNYWTKCSLRFSILCDKFHSQNYINPMSILKYIFLYNNLNNLYKAKYWNILFNSIDRMVKTSVGMQRGINKYNNDINILNKQLLSDFSDKDTINKSKLNKITQLNKLNIRYKNINIQLEKLFILLAKEFIRVSNIFYNRQQQSDTKESSLDNENNNNINNDNIMEDDLMMDDDMLMSESTFHEQEKKTKKLIQTNISKKKLNLYLFNIIKLKLLQFFRIFRHYINIKTWNYLDENIFNIKQSCLPQIRDEFINAKQLLYI